MNSISQDQPFVVALAGGVGGARLVDGLDRALPSGSLSVVVNTSDDFMHWGLHISPDLDTVMYTLAGLSPEERGWGIEGDSFQALAEAQRRGADSWFQLGDRDLMTHVLRSAALARGDSLTRVTADLAHSLAVRRHILPMTDAPRPTTVVTQAGEELEFQQWLVQLRAEPALRAIRRVGRTQASPEVLNALRRADLVVICPSNPYVSIDPILELDGVSDALRNAKTVAVSPILGGRAVKGPLATMLREIDACPASAEAVAAHYEGLLDGYAVHHGDAFSAAFPILETNILIQSPEDRLGFARELIEFSRSL